MIVRAYLDHDGYSVEIPVTLAIRYWVAKKVRTLAFKLVTRCNRVGREVGRAL